MKARYILTDTEILSRLRSLEITVFVTGIFFTGVAGKTGLTENRKILVNFFGQANLNFLLTKFIQTENFGDGL